MPVYLTANPGGRYSCLIFFCEYYTTEPGGIATILLGIGILFRFFCGQIQALKRRVSVVFVHPCPGVTAQEGRQIGGGFLLLLGYVRDGEFQVKSPFKNLFYVLAFFIASIMRRS